MNFFKRIFELIFGDAKTRAHYRLMKTILKDIKSSGFSNFYKPFSRNVTPRFALYFYEIYKMCAEPQKIFRSPDITAVLKNTVLNYFIDDEAREMIDRLKTKYINEQHESGIAVTSLSEQVNETIDALNKKLDYKWRGDVDHYYKLVSSFVWLVNFNCYELLKNFNDKFMDYVFTPTYVFYQIPAIKIVSQLKDFLSIADGIEFDGNWDVVFDILQSFNQKAVVSHEIRRDVFSRISNVIRSRILHLIIRHASNDPEWENEIVLQHQIIATSFLNEITSTVHKAMFTILSTEKENSVDKFKMSLFGSNEDIVGAAYYTEDRNVVYDGMGIEGFKYTTIFNYCIAFFSLYFNKLKAICDMFIIYGKWSNPDDMHWLSQCLHEITILNEQLLQYDRSLSPSGERGSKLEHLEANSVQGRSHRNNLRRYIISINDEVLAMISRTVGSMSSLHIFLVKIKTHNEAELTKEIVNARTVCAMLHDSGCDIISAEEKSASFLSLLKRLGFEKLDTYSQ
jgi:hypothetical protein